jgi:hypothetical protein
VIRYPWYAATLLGACPTWLTFARYTAFIGLYPLGVVAEMVLLHVSARLRLCGLGDSGSSDCKACAPDYRTAHDRHALAQLVSHHVITSDHVACRPAAHMCCALCCSWACRMCARAA